MYCIYHGLSGAEVYTLPVVNLYYAKQDNAIVHTLCVHTHTHTHTLSLSFHLCPSLALSLSLSLFNSPSLPLPLYLSCLPLSPPSLCPPSLSSPPSLCPPSLSPPLSLSHHLSMCATVLFYLPPSFFIECLIIHVATPLCLCHYRNGHLTVVQYLVEKYSADVNLKDSYGRTPLHDACR